MTAAQCGSILSQRGDGLQLRALGGHSNLLLGLLSALGTSAHIGVSIYWTTSICLLFTPFAELIDCCGICDQRSQVRGKYPMLKQLGQVDEISDRPPHA